MDQAQGSEVKRHGSRTHSLVGKIKAPKKVWDNVVSALKQGGGGTLGAQVKTSHF